jgi:hypothetical protein
MEQLPKDAKDAKDFSYKTGFHLCAFAVNGY